MAHRAKPHVHGRDHEHGGADTTLIHYDTVGGAGAGGAQGIYSLDSGTSLGGGLHLFEWAHVGGDLLLDLADDFHPHPSIAGVYAYNFAFNFHPAGSFTVPVGGYATYSFTATGSSGFAAGWQETRYEAVANIDVFLYAYSSVVLHQDPAAGAPVYAGVTSNVTTVTGDKYSGGVFVQRIS